MLKIQRLAATYLLLFGLVCCGRDPNIYDQNRTKAPTQTGQNYYPKTQKKLRQYYQAPYQRVPYSKQRGGSRYYSNPYAIPPSSRYNVYDADHYYVPPSYYGVDQHPSITEKHY